MTFVLWVGSALGAIIGVLHACYVYRLEVREASSPLGTRPLATRARAAYYALWTFVLWLLFGSYVLVLWLISVVAYAVHKAFRLARA